jgi:transcription termination/antitermination protein NusG
MKHWYAVEVYAGYEDLVKTDLSKRIDEAGLQDFFGQILIPSIELKQLFDTSETSKSQRLFPGYMLVEMESVPQAMRLVRSSTRVIRVLGILSKQELDQIQAQIRGEVMLPKKHEFEVGKEVEIASGPFAGFEGKVETINEENEKVVVMVSILGRMTPVELQFDQIKS